MLFEIEFKKLIAFLVVVLLSQINEHDAATGENIYEYNILVNITNGYNSLVRPSSQILIDIKLSFKQISNLDEKNQILTSNSYFACFWSDSRLVWDINSFGDTHDVLIPSSKLWMPDLFIINTASTSGYVPIQASSLAWVRYDGAVYVVFYISSQQTRCNLNMKYYPFDTQNCSIVIGSWMMDSNKLTFITDSKQIDSSSYTEHAVWELMLEQLILMLEQLIHQTGFLAWTIRHSTRMFRLILFLKEGLCTL